jgi:Uma2 family endonuclease
VPPDAPEHFDLIDGELVPRARQTIWHMLAVDAVMAALAAQAPADLEVARRMTVVCGPHQAPEPDLCLVRRVYDLEAALLDASDIRLVVEVVSPDSDICDKERKPRIYAAAGIPHYWIVDREGQTTVVHAYDLDPVRRVYGPATIFRDRTDVAIPFPVSVDLSKERLISGLRGA